MKRFVCGCLVMILAFVGAVPVTASKLKDTQQKKQSVEKKISSVQEQKKIEEKNIKTAAEKEKQLKQAQAKEDKERQQLLDELKLINAELNAFDNEIKESEEKYANQKELLKTRLRAMYKNSISSNLQTIFAAKSISDLLSRIEYIKRMSERDKQLMALFVEAKKDVEYKRSVKDEQRGETVKLANAKEDKLEQLSVSRAGLEEQIRKSKQKLEQLEKEEDELLKQNEQLMKDIKKLLSSSKSYAGGSMKWPVPSSGVISSPYGNRLHPIFKKWKMHTGIDISARSGVSILAANKGRVVVAGWKNGYGKTVIIDHGGGRATLYAHCSRLLVSVGDEVKAGEVIAKVGSTGYSTGPHLHFEVIVNGKTQNPQKYVRP